jgi:antitoxin component of MazEF toxin-antitoxin module
MDIQLDMNSAQLTLNQSEVDLMSSSGIKEGSQLEITKSGNGLLITPIEAQAKRQYFNPYSEADLLKGLTPDLNYTDITFEPTPGELGFD